MNHSVSNRIARFALAVAVALLLELILIALFFAFGQPFGALNDASIALAALLSAGLAWATLSKTRASIIGLIVACVGGVIAALGSVFVITGITGWVLASWYGQVGYALIGVWLLLFCDSARRNQTLPRGWTNFGFVIGALMVLGLFAAPGIVSKTDSMDALTWYLALSQISYLGAFLLYPVWCYGLWRYLTRNNVTASAS